MDSWKLWQERTLIGNRSKYYCCFAWAGDKVKDNSMLEKLSTQVKETTETAQVACESFSSEMYFLSGDSKWKKKSLNNLEIITCIDKSMDYGQNWLSLALSDVQGIRWRRILWWRNSPRKWRRIPWWRNWLRKWGKPRKMPRLPVSVVLNIQSATWWKSMRSF